MYHCFPYYRSSKFCRETEEILKNDCEVVGIHFTENNGRFQVFIEVPYTSSGLVYHVDCWPATEQEKAILFNGLRNNTNLKFLGAHTLSLGDESTAALVDFISKSKSLERLDVESSTTKFSPKGLSMIGEAIGKSATLQELYLNIHHECAIPEVARGILKCTTLQKLRIVGFPADVRILEAMINSDSILEYFFDHCEPIRNLRWIFEDYAEMMEEMRFLGVDFLSSS